MLESARSTINLTFSSRMLRQPLVTDFNVSVDNVSVEVLNVTVNGSDGRVYLHVNTTVWDPMQPVDVSYVKAPLPRNISDHNGTFLSENLTAATAVVSRNTL